MSLAAFNRSPLEHLRTDRPPRLLESRVDACDIIPTVPWLSKRGRSLTVIEYIASYLGFLDARRFQISPVGTDDERRIKVTVGGRTYDVSTRRQSWEAHCRHMSMAVFASSVYASLEFDTPYFRFETERRYVHNVLGEIRNLRDVLANDPYHQLKLEPSNIPLSTWCELKEEWFMIDAQRWARDLDTEWRVAELPQHGHHTSFLSTEYWEILPSRRDLVFVPVSDTEPRHGTNRVITCPTARPYLYFGRFFCRLDFSQHDFTEVSELPRRDDQVRELIRVHAVADACRSEFGRFLLLVFFGPGAVYNYLGDAALHMDYDRFRGILVPLTPACINWVADHSIYELTRGLGLPIDLVMLAFERTQVVDWDSCRKDAERLVDGMTGHFHHVPDFFRYDFDSGDIDDLPRRRVGNRFESYARHVPVRFVSSIGKDKTPLDMDVLAYRPYCITEYCRREFPPSLLKFTYKLKDEGEYRDFTDQSVRDRRNRGMPADWYRNRTRGVGLLSNRIQHLSRREKEEFAFRDVGPETQAERNRRAQRARDLGVPDAVDDEIVPVVPNIPNVPSDPPEFKSNVPPIPKSVPNPESVPKPSCGLSMPWDTGSQVSGLDVIPDVPDVKRIKDEAKQELRKELEKKILVPMRSKLRGSGMIRSGGSAEQLLPSLDSVGEHYCGVVTQLGKAADLFKRQKDQLLLRLPLS